MRRKGILTLLITVFSVVAFAGMAFAAQNIFLKTTVPNIPKSACYQAGTESLSFDNATRLTNGDVMTFTLSNNVTLCKNINFYLRLHDGLANAITGTAADPVTSTDITTDTLVLGGGTAGNDYGLLVRGNVGSQLVTLQLVARNTTTGAVSSATAFTLTFVAGAPTNQFIVKLFDEKFLTPYFWKISSGSAYLNDSAFAAVPPATAFNATDNTLCINTESPLWLGEFVLFAGSSQPNFGAGGIGVNFSGDFDIAHMFSSARYQASGLSCGKDQVIGHIAIGTAAAEQGASDFCTAFDFETADGYCSDHTDRNRVIIQSLDGPFVAADYTLQLEIQVDRQDGNGFQSGDRGVYFAANSAPLAISGSSGSICDATPLAIGTATRYLANGTSTSSGAPDDLSCSISTSARAVILRTALNPMNISGTDSFLKIDIPRLKYNLASIKAGDVVRVRVSLTRGSCITIGPIDFVIGTFGCALAPQSGFMLFPYFTSLTAGSGATDWWNGIAIINRGTTAGTATLTATQKDNVVATATVTVPAKSVYANVLENITWTGTVNGAACYIEVQTNFSNPDGFGMIAKEVTGESMGYLPRISERY